MKTIIRLALGLACLLPALLLSSCGWSWARINFMVLDEGAFRVHNIKGVGLKKAWSLHEPNYTFFDSDSESGNYIAADASSRFSFVDTTLALNMPLSITWAEDENPGTTTTCVMEGVIMQPSPAATPEFVSFSGERLYANQVATFILYQRNFWLILTPDDDTASPADQAESILRSFLKEQPKKG